MRRTIATFGLLLSTPAFGAGLSSDVELVQPAFSEGGTPGVDTPVVPDVRTVRIGSLVQLEHDPIILYRGGRYDTDVVRWRTMVQLGTNVTIARHLALALSFPMSIQAGGTAPDLLSNGLAAGDLEAGLRWQALAHGPWVFGARGDIAVPLGTREAWMSESTLRPSLMLLARGRWGPVTALANVRGTWRPEVETGLDYTMGPTLDLDGGALLEVLPERFSLAWSFVSRTGFTRFFEGGAETASELLGGVQIWPVRDVQVDAGAGLGIAGGVGAADWRVLSGITWQPHPPPPQPLVPPTRIANEAPPEDIVVEPEPQPVKIWREGELARVEERQIVIRDPIQFVFAKDVILPVSHPTLDAIAEVLRTNANIAYIVIEGHASEEGSFAYNYDLSDRRARAVFQALILAGVHPDRLSYRGMGEVVPAALGEQEDQLAVNRRVVFRIVRVYQPGEVPPVYPSDVLIPWNGEPGRVTQPPPPEPEPARPPPPEPERTDPGLFEDIEEEP